MTKRAGQSCACCAAQGELSGEAGPVMLEQVSASAARLGIAGEDQQLLMQLASAGDCRATLDLMAKQVGDRLATAERHVAELIGQTASTHSAQSHRDVGMPQAVADLHHDTVSALETVARLQTATAHLTQDVPVGACSAGCPCATVADPAPADSPTTPVMRLAPATDVNGPEIACTLDGGIEAMRGRIADWQQVTGRATSRSPIDHGVILAYDHNEQLTVELARLAAAEFACCSFFEFTLRVGPTGMTFSVTAPEEAGDVIIAMFGAYGSTATGGR